MSEGLIYNYVSGLGSQCWCHLATKFSDVILENIFELVVSHLWKDRVVQIKSETL